MPAVDSDEDNDNDSPMEEDSDDEYAPSSSSSSSSCEEPPTETEHGDADKFIIFWACLLPLLKLMPISNCRRSVADRDETQHDLPPRLCNAAVRPVKAEAVAEHQGRFSAPTGRGEDE